MLLIKQPQIYIFWGTHGNEAIITRPFAELIFNQSIEIHPKGTHIIGPVSPWSSRNEYRYDRLMSDPNRTLDECIPINGDYLQLLKEWRSYQPKDLEQLQAFLVHINHLGLDIGQLFTCCQSNERDFFGYVNLKMHQKRVKYLTGIIAQKIDQEMPSYIMLIDIHAGIGQDAKTILFYEGDGKINSRKYLIDAIASNIDQKFNIPVRTLILETGVVNNGFGLINVLSEIAFRTYGFNQPIPKISQICTPDWILKAKKQFDINIIGEM